MPPDTAEDQRICQEQETAGSALAIMLFLTQSGRCRVGSAPGGHKAYAGGAARHRAPWPAIAPSARPAGLVEAKERRAKVPDEGS